MFAMKITKRIQYNSDFEASRWVGFFDLLGIKNIVKNNDTVSVFVLYAKAIEQISNRGTAFDNVEFVWFSDSFLIHTTDDSIQSFAAIDNICHWFCYFLITGGMPVPVRGSISCSSFYADGENNLFFGKALIEAYEYGEAQDWIGFILCPSAKKQLEVLGRPAERLSHYAYTNIPFNKRESELIHYLPACILGQWVSPNPCIDSLIKMRDRATDDRIIQKYENTIRFIESNKRNLSLGVDR
jgi:hypothetical protein